MQDLSAINLLFIITISMDNNMFGSNYHVNHESTIGYEYDCNRNYCQSQRYPEIEQIFNINHKLFELKDFKMLYDSATYSMNGKLSSDETNKLAILLYLSSLPKNNLYLIRLTYSNKNILPKYLNNIKNYNHPLIKNNKIIEIYNNEINIINKSLYEFTYNKNRYLNFNTETGSAYKIQINQNIYHLFNKIIDISNNYEKNICDNITKELEIYKKFNETNFNSYEKDYSYNLTQRNQNQQLIINFEIVYEYIKYYTEKFLLFIDNSYIDTKDLFTNEYNKTNTIDEEEYNKNLTNI